MLELIECLICEHVYKEKSKMVLICPNCKNEDLEQTIYLAPESEIFKNYEEKINVNGWRWIVRLFFL